MSLTVSNIEDVILGITSKDIVMQIVDKWNREAQKQIEEKTEGDEHLESMRELIVAAGLSHPDKEERDKYFKT